MKFGERYYIGILAQYVGITLTRGRCSLFFQKQVIGRMNRSCPKAGEQYFRPKDSICGSWVTEMDAGGLLFSFGVALSFERKDDSMENIANLIENNHFYHVFQPLRRLPDQGKVGYEALIRSTSGIGPNALFQGAIEQNRLYQLDTWSIDHALSSFFFFSGCTRRRVVVH